MKYPFFLLLCCILFFYGCNSQNCLDNCLPTGPVPSGQVVVSLQMPQSQSAPLRVSPDEVLQHIYLVLFQTSDSGTVTGGSGLFDYAAREGVVDCKPGTFIIYAMGLDADMRTRFTGILGNVTVRSNAVTETSVGMEEGSVPSSTQLESAGLDPSVSESWNWDYVPGSGFQPVIATGVTGLKALPWSATSIDLYFTVPYGITHTQYIVRRGTSSYPLSATEGTSAGSGSLTVGDMAVTDTSVSSEGTTYYYTVFTTDGTSYSAGVNSSVKLQDVHYTDSWMDIGCTNGTSDTVYGNKIRVFDQSGVFCGKTVVTTSTGNFDLTHCYYDDTLATLTVDEGGTDGETMTVYINGRRAVATPSVVWNKNTAQQLLTLDTGL
ncbi:MAG: hypothetical protein PHQ23_05855 [Candidatus Wallbacteria bacterium]|nr:hypothetical protein [Candidatus Wallbacteria bacterium]